MKILFKGPAIRVQQPIGEFWAAAIPASVLLKATMPDPLRIAIDPNFRPNDNEWRSALKMLGNQRPIEDKRIQEIANYIDTVEATFPNSIIISSSSESSLKDENRESAWRVEGPPGSEQLIIPAAPHKASIVDGQHRLYSFLKSRAAGRQDFALLCAIFFDMPHSVQAMVFATINTNQKPVRRGLALNLYGYNVEDQDRTQWSPEKLSVFIARRLNFDKESRLHNRIKIEAGNAPAPDRIPGATRSVPMAAIVDGVLDLITQNPQKDRSALSTERVLRRPQRKDLPVDNSVLRQWYLACADRAIYLLVRVFIEIVDEILWNKGVEGSMLSRAVGIRALFELFSLTLEEANFRAIPPPISDAEINTSLLTARQTIRTALEKCQSIDFTDPFFEATGRGQRRIYNALRVKSLLANFEDLPPSDRDDYARILGG